MPYQGRRFLARSRQPKTEGRLSDCSENAREGVPSTKAPEFRSRGDGNPRWWAFSENRERGYRKPCLASLSRKVEGFMPRAAAAAVLFPFAPLSAFSKTWRSAPCIPP